MSSHHLTFQTTTIGIRVYINCQRMLYLRKYVCMRKIFISIKSHSLSQRKRKECHKNTHLKSWLSNNRYIVGDATVQIVISDAINQDLLKNERISSLVLQQIPFPKLKVSKSCLLLKEIENQTSRHLSTRQSRNPSLSSHSTFLSMLITEVPT